MIEGIGVDIVEHDRVNLKIAKRVLTDVEYEIFLSKKNKVEYLASRFAAKEAIIKATDKKYGMLEIEITNSVNGKPNCNIKGIELSISHENKNSIAFAIYKRSMDE